MIREGPRVIFLKPALIHLSLTHPFLVLQPLLFLSAEARFLPPTIPLSLLALVSLTS
jgi:hypothetical protein